MNGRFSLPLSDALIYSRRVALGLLLLLSCGCANEVEGPQRFDVVGKVTFDGKPVPMGRIVFEPDGSKGNKGPVSVAGIKDGLYDTSQPGAKSPVEGPLIVRIIGYGEPDPNAEVQKELFPEYETSLEFTATGAKSTLDFDVPTTSR